MLVVEDHDDSREMLELSLEYAGALVTAASSARRALEISATARPDIVVTDLAMPGEDGVWLAEQIRARGARMPIIALSGYAPAFAKRLTGALFTVVLHKPVDPSHVVDVVVLAGQSP